MTNVAVWAVVICVVIWAASYVGLENEAAVILAALGGYSVGSSAASQRYRAG